VSGWHQALRWQRQRPGGDAGELGGLACSGGRLVIQRPPQLSRCLCHGCRRQLLNNQLGQVENAIQRKLIEEQANAMAAAARGVSERVCVPSIWWQQYSCRAGQGRVAGCHAAAAARVEPSAAVGGRGVRSRHAWCCEAHTCRLRCLYVPVAGPEAGHCHPAGAGADSGPGKAGGRAEASSWPGASRAAACGVHGGRAQRPVAAGGMAPAARACGCVGPPGRGVTAGGAGGRQAGGQAGQGGHAGQGEEDCRAAGAEQGDAQGETGVADGARGGTPLGSRGGCCRKDVCAACVPP
jgi:hypothetical protein